MPLVLRRLIGISVWNHELWLPQVIQDIGKRSGRTLPRLLSHPFAYARVLFFSFWHSCRSSLLHPSLWLPTARSGAPPVKVKLSKSGVAVRLPVFCSSESDINSFRSRGRVSVIGTTKRVFQAGSPRHARRMTLQPTAPVRIPSRAQ